MVASTSQKNITPRFEFGFGLSYTTFKYSDLSIQAIDAGDDPADADSVSAWENGNATPIAEGSSRAFWYVDFDDPVLSRITEARSGCTNPHSAYPLLSKILVPYSVER